MIKHTRLIDLNATADSSQVAEIISSRNTMMRMPTDWQNSVEERISFLKENGFIVFGFFHDDQLISFLSVMPWKKMPYYTMSNFFVRAGAIKVFSIKNSGMPDLFTAAINYMENLHYYTFYYIRADERWPIKNKKKKNLGFDDLCQEYKRYIVTMEEIINPGERSQYPMHSILLGDQQVSDLKRVILRYTLPNELRHWGYELHEQF